MSFSGDAPQIAPAWLQSQPGFWFHLWRGGIVRQLLAGLTPLLAAAGVLVIAAAAATTDSAEMRKHYLAEAIRHYQASNHQAACLGFERVAGWDGPDGDRQVRYNLAVCLATLGQLDRAVTLIDALAPNDRPGYALAHLWKARRLWYGSGHKPTPTEVRAGEQQLLLTLQGDANSVEANALLGLHYMATGKVVRAIPLLERASRERPTLLLALARARLSQNDGMLATRHAREARRIFQERAEANLEDREARLYWADADVVLEEFAEAVKVLEREVLLKSDTRYPQALARVYLAWYDFKARTEPARLDARLALLERGLTHDPANLALLIRFSDQVRARGADGDRARAALLDLQARGLALGPVRYILGVDAWDHGRVAEARLHWEEAYRLTPEVPMVANNLAWLLAEGPNPDVPRALATINPILERYPEEAIFRETRGEILVKLKRWKEARPDLEAALTRKPDSPKLHRILAETYEHLEAPGLAAEHRKRAEPQPTSAAPAPESKTLSGP